MRVFLGVSTGFAINRYVEPEDWTRIVAEDLGINIVQFTADLLNPDLPADLVQRQTNIIRRLCDDRNIRVETTFTSQFTRVNHLLHPDPEFRAVWMNWFRRFFKISADLGAEGAGSHFGIMTVRDNASPDIREKRMNDGVHAWRCLSEDAAKMGLQYLIWEPMSVSREVGETIAATTDIQKRCAQGFAIPMKLCLDVDHGDLQSTDPNDTDPHAWIRAFGKDAPVIHIKQSLREKGGHYPFTAAYNAQGKIIPEEILSTLRNAGVEKCTLLLEISHRERWPFDYRVVSDLQESVEYWRPAIAAANQWV